MWSKWFEISTSDAIQRNGSDILQSKLNGHIVPKNPDFLAHFWRLFDYTLLRPLSYAPMFMPNQSSHGDAQSW